MLFTQKYNLRVVYKIEKSDYSRLSKRISLTTLKWLFLPPYLNYDEKNSNLSLRRVEPCLRED